LQRKILVAIEDLERIIEHARTPDVPQAVTDSIEVIEANITLAKKAK
jgi:hypothetical protein